jgi:hypothetical protein
MTWYAANIIMYTKFKDGKQDYYPIYENIILIEAKDEKEAHEKAIKRGKSDEDDSSGTYLYDKRPAILVYAGIRKITQCEDPDQRPGDGTEITYSEFLVDSNDKLMKLIKGDSVEILYDD